MTIGHRVRDAFEKGERRGTASHDVLKRPANLRAPKAEPKATDRLVMARRQGTKMNTTSSFTDKVYPKTSGKVDPDDH